MKKLVISIVIFLIQITSSYSQTIHKDILQIRLAFQQLDYQTAKSSAEKVLQAWQQYNVTELIEVHKILGVIAYSEGNLIEAQTQFEHALSLDETSELDSVLISPKIISFFNKTKASFKNQTPISAATQFRYILLPDHRVNAVLRSLVLPGWGQIYKGQKKKGKILLATSGICICTWGTFYILQKKAHNKYLDASKPVEIEERYQEYNRLYKSQRICAYITGALWLYSIADVLITQPTPQNNISFYPGINNKCLYLTVAWKF